jgi:secretion/DNA translocation related TadE-like protein
MTHDQNDVWRVRRRLGEMLRRWASSTRAIPRVGIPADPPPRDPVPPGNARARFGKRGNRHRRRDRDRGAATIFLLGVGSVLVAAGVAGAAVGSARIGRHQAQIAADLGALAGAAHAIEGEEAACAQAARFAAANHGRLTSCHLDGLDIVLRTDVALTPLRGVTRHAQASARAGPVYVIPP